MAITGFCEPISFCIKPYPGDNVLLAYTMVFHCKWLSWSGVSHIQK